MQKNLNIRTLGDENFMRLRSSKRKGKYINNTCSYDILHNYRYRDAFFYTEIALRSENDSSDVIA